MRIRLIIEIFSMDLYGISAGDNRTAQYKQNFESSELDVSGLHCSMHNTSCMYIIQQLLA